MDPNAPRKHALSLEARQNHEKTSKPPAKRVKSIKFLHSDEIETEFSPDSSSSSEENE